MVPASAPQALRLSVYFSTLSINGGPDGAATLPGVVAQFTYSLYDVDYGANDIQYARFYLPDGAGNAHCDRDWGRPSALDLYDSGTGATSGFGINRATHFAPSPQVVGASRKGKNWRLLSRNPWDQEVILDDSYSFVSTRRLDAPVVQ